MPYRGNSIEGSNPSPSATFVMRRAGWSGYPALEHEGDAWRVAQSHPEGGTAILELQAEGPLGAELAAQLLAALQSELHTNRPAWVTAALRGRHQGEELPVEAGGIWMWSQAITSELTVHVRVTLPPSVGDAGEAARFMAVSLRQTLSSLRQRGH
jgi:hypothetical protein